MHEKIHLQWLFVGMQMHNTTKHRLRPCAYNIYNIYTRFIDVKSFHNTIWFMFLAIQKKEAELYDRILAENTRPIPEYFRVGYYGQGFPSFLQASGRDNFLKKINKMAQIEWW